MDVKLLRILYALLVLTGGTSFCIAQDQESPDAALQTVRLLSAIRHKDDDRGALFNFEHGLRNDSPAKPPQHRYDIRYGGISENGDDAWLELYNKRGSHSVMQDLGPRAWSEMYNVPIVSASPNPHTGPVTHSYERGKLVKIEPEGVIVKATVGHIYVLHVKEGGADYYAVFRVESIDQKKGEIMLTWKLVQSPEG